MEGRKGFYFTFLAFLEEEIVNIMKYIMHMKEYMRCTYVV